MVGGGDRLNRPTPPAAGPSNGEDAGTSPLRVTVQRMTEVERALRRVPDRPLVTAVIAGLAALLLVGATIVRSDGDVSRLVHAAPPWTDPVRAPGSLTVQETSEGFDGQFFYRLGVDPWSTDRQVAGVTYDLPSLRNARWGWVIAMSRERAMTTATKKLVDIIRDEAAKLVLDGTWKTAVQAQS